MPRSGGLGGGGWKEWGLWADLELPDSLAVPLSCYKVQYVLERRVVAFS